MYTIYQHSNKGYLDGLSTFYEIKTEISSILVNVIKCVLCAPSLDNEMVHFAFFLQGRKLATCVTLQQMQ